MKNKDCSKCKEVKSVEFFYKKKATSEERRSQCKDCMSKHQQTERGKASQAKADKKRSQSKKRKVSRTKYKISEKGKAANNRYKVKNPHKGRAHYLVSRAIKKGELKRPPFCAVCWTPCIPEAHHDDYNHPLEVRWLCTSCHNDWHKNNEAIRHKESPCSDS